MRDDLISRQAALKAVAWDTEAYMALNMLPSGPQWIPVTERLPDEEKRSYWVCTDSGYQYECRWTNNVFGLHESDYWDWSVFDTPPYSNVIAWMPLPEPYKQEEKQ